MEIPEEDIKQICTQLELFESEAKIAAIDNLQTFCSTKTTDGNTPLTMREFRLIFDEVYVHLLKCYKDCHEFVRLRAVQIVTYFLKRLNPIDFHTIDILTTLKKRMSRRVSAKENEETRLQYAAQLNLLIQQYTRPDLVNSCHDICGIFVDILCQSVGDESPAVLKIICASIVILTAVDGLLSENNVEELMKSLCGIQYHKNSQVRIAGIKAISHLTLHVKNNSDLLIRTMIEMIPLLMDPMPLVRRECGKMGVLFAMKLGDRYMYFDRIIPFILCCLKDDSPDVVNYIRPLWIECGEQFYEENKTELYDQALADIPPENYPQELNRPTIGCRGLVRRSLRSVHLIVRELCTWDINMRIHLLKLLYQFQLHAEASMSTKFFVIYSDLAHICSDINQTVASETIRLVELMGLLLPYDTWFKIILDRLEIDPNIGFLKLFYHLFDSTDVIRINDILDVTKVLVQPIYSRVLRGDYQLYLLCLLGNVLSKASVIRPNNDTSFEMQEIEMNVYTATIKVMAMGLAKETYIDDEVDCIVQTTGNELLHQLAEWNSISLGQIHAKYFLHALKYVVNLEVAISELSEPVLLLSGLIKIAQFRAPYMAALQEKILIVWNGLCDDSRYKIFSSISIAMYSWHKTMTATVNIEESTRLLSEFVDVIIKQYFEGDANIHANTMRMLATSTLYAITEGAFEESREILPIQVAKYMPQLLEDPSCSTRYYAIKSLCNFGPLCMDDMRPIAYTALQCMDDTSEHIREIAALLPVELEPIFQPKEDEQDLDYDLESWESFIAYACDMLLLHYDNVDENFQRIAKSTIIELYRNYRHIVREVFANAVSEHYYSNTLAQLHNQLFCELQ